MGWVKAAEPSGGVGVSQAAAAEDRHVLVADRQDTPQTLPVASNTRPEDVNRGDDRVAVLAKRGNASTYRTAMDGGEQLRDHDELLSFDCENRMQTTRRAPKRRRTDEWHHDPGIKVSKEIGLYIQ